MEKAVSGEYECSFISFCAPRCCYVGRTLVLESEGSKPIPLMEKYMHILTGLSFLFMYLFDVSMRNMNGPSGIMCMETSNYVCFAGRLDKLRFSTSLPGYHFV